MFAEIKRIVDEDITSRVSQYDVIFEAITNGIHANATSIECVLNPFDNPIKENDTEIAKNKNAIGFVENHQAAKAGGSVAGNACKELEKKSGKKIVSKENLKALTENSKKNLE